MALTLASEIWSEIKRYLPNSTDRTEAAESLISLLIDNDFDVEDIRDAFKGDTDIKKSLQSYLVDRDLDEEDEEEEDYKDDDY